MKTLSLAAPIAAALLAAGCFAAQGTEAKPPRPVKTELVAAAPASGRIRYSASIEPYEQVTLAFKASGYVDDVMRRPGADGRSRLAQPGDLVSKGAVLARVREGDYRQRLAQGHAALAEGEAAADKARLDLDRARTLFAAESLIKPDLDGAQANFDATAARVAAARADIEVAANALHDCALVSPASGILLERRIEVGSLVGGGTVGFVLGDVSSVKARFGIPDSVVASVKPGDAIGVEIEALQSTKFSGHITAISPAADPKSRVFDVEVTIRNQDGRLRPGMIGTVALAAPPADTSPAAALPLSAVVRLPSDSTQYAAVVIERNGDGDIARVRRVELGDVIGNGVAVKSGVASGDRVVTAGATLVHDGDRVRVIP